MLTICIILIVLLALDLLFTLALRCRKGHPKWELLKKYRYAHRGFHDKPVIPENSLPAFRRAIEHGFGAELDVHLLKDGTLAVFHDSDLRRCANVDGQIEDLTLEELKQLRLEGTDEQIPTFDEVLALFESATPLIIELKTARGNHQALAKAVCERLDTYKGEFCIESFDPFCVLDVKKLRPEICRGQLSMNFCKDPSGLPFYKRVIAGNMLLNFLTRPEGLLPACLRAHLGRAGGQLDHPQKRGPARLRGRRQHPHLRTLRPGRTVKNRPPQLVEAGSYGFFGSAGLALTRADLRRRGRRARGFWASAA